MTNGSRFYKWLVAVMLASACVTASGLQFAQEKNTLAEFHDLPYPRVALPLRLQGVVVLRVELSADGMVKNAVVLTGQKLLADAALENIRRWRFKPGTTGDPVVVYNFEIDQSGGCHDESRSLFRLRHYNYAVITACTPVVVG